MTLYAVLFAPFALWGLVNNVAPYALARGAWESAPEEAIRAIRGFGVAFVAFPFFYALQGFALYALLREEPSWPWWVSSYLGSLPPAGFFWLRYTRQQVLALFDEWVLSIPLEDQDMARVVRARANLNKELNSGAKLKPLWDIVNRYHKESA